MSKNRIKKHLKAEHPALSDDTTKLNITPNAEGDEIGLSAVPILDGTVTDEALALMMEQLPSAQMPEGAFNEEEMMGDLTAAKFLQCRDGQEKFYSGFFAGMMGTMTLLNICTPGLIQNPRFALIYRVMGKAAKHLTKLREDGPQED